MDRKQFARSFGSKSVVLYYGLPISSISFVPNYFFEKFSCFLKLLFHRHILFGSVVIGNCVPDSFYDKEPGKDIGLL